MRPGTSGRPVPGYEIRIVGPDGGELPAGQPGRLQVKGDSTAVCYWNNPEKTAEAMRGDWLDTGDTYLRDDDGYYRHCGRSDDMLKVGGLWCSPTEIESRLIDHPDVLEATVVGIPDASGNIKPRLALRRKVGRRYMGVLPRMVLVSLEAWDRTDFRDYLRQLPWPTDAEWATVVANEMGPGPI